MCLKTSSRLRGQVLDLARHVVTIPINRSSNGTGSYYDWDRDAWYSPRPVTNLILASRSNNIEGVTRVIYIGLDWDESIVPKDAVIVSKTVNLYSVVNCSSTTHYAPGEFTEGQNIGSPSLVWRNSIPVTNGWYQLTMQKEHKPPIKVGQHEINSRCFLEFHSHRNPTNKPYVVITYDDPPPSPPTNLSPDNIDVNKAEVIRLSWRHNSSAGYYQKGFTLQYSTNNGGSWTTVSRTTSSQYYDLPANTFTASGPVLWRVMTVDGNSEVSEYSTATFTTKTPPSPPINLTPKNAALNPRNVIRFNWKHQSVEGTAQKGFNLEYSTNNQGNWTTVNKSTDPNQFYDMPANTFPLKGSVQWRVRTIDANGLSSNYGTSDFTLKTPPDDPVSLYPNNITLNPREIIKFSWLHKSNSDLGQLSFTLQYSTNSGSTWETITETTTNQFYDMPPITLPTSGVTIWKVKTTDGNGLESNYKSASFTLGTPPQQAPIPIQPVGSYLDSTETILFEWHFMGGTPGEKQTKFELQYSINSGSDWETLTETTDRKSLELAANTFNLTGNITWRIRTYNNFNEVSPYSDEKTFYVISSPPIPQILNISNNARPIIKWTSQGQHIYEIEILKDSKVLFSSGSIPSVSDREYKLEEYLEDGNYTVRLRVTNEYNLYSNYAEKSFNISTVKPPKPIISVYDGEYTTTIKVSNTSDTNLVYRDNILIGEVIGNKFVDFTGNNNKEHKYFIRAVNVEDNFHDSNMKLGKCSFKNNTLATSINPEEFIKLKYGFGSVPGKNSRKSIEASLNYYDGREYPIAEYTNFKSLDKSLSFFVKSIEEVRSVIDLIEKKKLLIFRDYDGENIKGTVFNINYDKQLLGYNISFTITKTEV